ncbi:MerR family transcriptional regulator [Pseudomonas sp. N040]|uniref:MerR family transcriptional regulator n=1 Tax=Pseudomonas sp. N040 TaxID=2785325 RepID=UPI0018A2B963|nr:MerR family transcriptional regulator [Pseudomonas sp. N040]MBF7730445.1 MerR family transcriptional regulator [Pseudomonas sp. N040]MBW7014088.1 MerR family transcriptional regulator [Pseudomonas sp. N040]
MRIGELAGLSGVAASTLRFYEGNGLLPAPRRAGNGYRDYPVETLERIGLIRLAQSLGFNLEQIRKVLASQGSEGSHAMIVQGLQARLEEIEQLQVRLGEQRQGILEMLDGLRNNPAGAACAHAGKLLPRQADRRG